MAASSGTESAASSDEGDENVFEVEAILAMRKMKGQERQYLIRWKGYTPEWDTWEPIENLDGCQKLLDDFHGA
jgi:hypothetical protein